MNKLVQVEGERQARMAWSCVVEPAETAAIAFVETMGAVDAWSWLDEQGGRLSDGRTSEVPKRLRKSVLRWHAAASHVTASSLEGRLARCGEVRVVIPGDADWPVILDDLQGTRPLALWVRGNGNLAELFARGASVVGARAASAYGIAATTEIVCGLAARGHAIISGGAYGIDAAAHRAALSVGGGTVAFMPGGVDVDYPAAHGALFRRICEQGGLVMAEMGPSARPWKSRFLHRNRLIAAAGRAAVVIEAGIRSGAMSTARQSALLSRPVGAVPGPITSRVSQGCHELMRTGVATCVYDADHVVEMIASLTAQWDEGRAATQGTLAIGAYRGRPRWLESAARGVAACVESSAHGARVGDVIAATGLAANTVMTALGELEAAGLVAWDKGMWVSTRQ
ncbi:DNA-processing protein DprA [Rarobacter incanus]|uniref:DNA protecting protein DprA n=1 Tax=Rarobacter incanus TaxID=153494 RepID=A0A542SLB0_9MICO|nr:DNA-processing protein DprA [Rarobacter incanus]TQK75424.1 DNA protecting protein DprA [Rarobacter incanus]